jgi:D-alanine-D-alanine ligase
METNKSRLRIGVLFGGRSAEHDVSVMSARNVIAALDPEVFTAVPIAITRDGRWLLQSTERLLREKGDPRAARIDGGGAEVTLFERTGMHALVERGGSTRTHALDVIFPIVHGPMGEDGTLQGLLELAGIPYVGAGVLGSAVGMDKDVMKRLLHEAGLPIGRFEVVRHYEYSRTPQTVLQSLAQLSYPLFVKPANLGSSIGISRVLSRSQLPGALEHAFSYDTKVIVEEGIEGAGQEPECRAGQESECRERRSAEAAERRSVRAESPRVTGAAREIECAVLGNDEPVASVPGELVVRHPDGFYSYDAKYIDAGVALKIPAELDAQQTREVQRLAVTAFRTLECSGLARVDFFLRPNGELLINEINTLPGFTAISMYPKLWAASGVQPRELVTRLIDLALTRHAKRRALRTMPSLRRAGGTQRGAVNRSSGQLAEGQS